jgi:multidrug efflux pump subunit AcrA (membrane-fusion protein)
MTIVGKILVFFVLVSSLVICGFTIMSYAARVNYDAALKEQKKQAQTAQANAAQFHEEMERAKADADNRVAAVEGEKKALREEAEGVKQQIAAYTRMVAEAQARAAQAETAAKAAQADVARRQADVEKLRDTLNTEIANNGKLVIAGNQLRDRAVAAEIQSKSLGERIARMEVQLREAEKTIVVLKQSSGSGGRSLGGIAGNPPPEHVEGLIKTADASGLLKLTIGSDAGLVKGHTLEVFRISPIASQSKYLGKVRILDVTPQEAVAQPIGRLSDKPQAGDHVADKILGGA